METRELESAIKVANTIHELLIAAKRERPYNINVIDELHANENAHSRILRKVLQYQDVEGRYRILESFVQYIARSVPTFALINVLKPIITQEEKRIDLWVRDKNYAIILENKVQGAIDQDHQLKRYVETTRSCPQGYKDNQIFVVYLPADNHEPSDNSWGDIKADFEDRYANISFKNDIIPWLKYDVLPQCTIREEMLVAAIKQYIDYLEGLFNLRSSQQKYYHMETEWLKKIGIAEESFADQFAHIEQLRKRLSDAQNMLDRYRQEHIDAVMQKFTDISLEVLGDTWGYKDSISDDRRWYFLYDKQWNTGAYVHIEWSGVSVENLFIQKESCEYTLLLHVEGVYRYNKEYTELLQKNLGKLYNRTTKNGSEFWRITLTTEKPIGEMSDREMQQFFRKAYCSDSTTGAVITAVAKTAQEYWNNQKNNK